MTRRDWIGAVVLIALFVVLIIVFVVTTRPKGGTTPLEDPLEDNFWVQQRMRNLRKSQQ